MREATKALKEYIEKFSSNERNRQIRKTRDPNIEEIPRALSTPSGVDRYKNHPGSYYPGGDPLGVWTRYGAVIICYPSQGLKPFNELFAPILGTTLGGASSIDSFYR